MLQVFWISDHWGWDETKQNSRYFTFDKNLMLAGSRNNFDDPSMDK